MLGIRRSGEGPSDTDRDIARSSMWPGALKVGVALAGRSSREGVIPSDVSDEHVAGLLEALPTPLKSGADGLW